MHTDSHASTHKDKSHTHTYTHACEHTYTGIPLRLHRGKSTSFKDCWKIKWKLYRWCRGERKQCSPTLLSYCLLSLLSSSISPFSIFFPLTLSSSCLIVSYPRFLFTLTFESFILSSYSLVFPHLSFYKLSPCISLHLAFLSSHRFTFLTFKAFLNNPTLSVVSMDPIHQTSFSHLPFQFPLYIFSV